MSFASDNCASLIYAKQPLHLIIADLLELSYVFCLPPPTSSLLFVRLCIDESGGYRSSSDVPPKALGQPAENGKIRSSDVE